MCWGSFTDSARLSTRGGRVQKLYNSAGSMVVSDTYGNRLRGGWLEDPPASAEIMTWFGSATGSIDRFKPRAADWPSSAGAVIGALAVARTRPTFRSTGPCVGVGLPGAGVQLAPRRYSIARIGHMDLSPKRAVPRGVAVRAIFSQGQLV